MLATGEVGSWESFVLESQLTVRQSLGSYADSESKGVRVVHKERGAFGHQWAQQGLTRSSLFYEVFTIPYIHSS